MVAPHGGAWIETYSKVSETATASVAPHGGAWIETLQRVRIKYGFAVAPHGGAWIETDSELSRPVITVSSPLTEGRGLKQAIEERMQREQASPLTKECGNDV